ncbi:AraC family transcriptional regulator ligand-binding domain-containing protein [Nocardia sp. NPDC051900]|uniref:AraC family transcriptional regulator ligand-binding domain-containing protein n=1 Tax=Nocardia sp. NPDC051900 TaxID=3364326 RepID=UPI003787DA34
MANRADMRLHEAVIPPLVLTGVVEIGQREGLPTVSWFAGTGLDPNLLVTSPELKVSYQQAATILRRAVRAMPDRPLGMQVGMRDVLLTFGMLGMAMRSCVTTADAMAVGLELHQASGSLVDLEAELFDHEVALRLRERAPEPRLIAFLCEEVLCSTVVFLRTMLGAGWSPTRIELSYTAPKYAHDYRRFFHCPVWFGADANRLVFPVADLDRPFPTPNDPIRAVAIDACRRLLDIDSTRPDVVMAVESLLDHNLRHPMTMAEIAQRLHITERTLRRQLASAGERFHSLRDRVRARRATYLLHESTLTIEAIAREVGFGDARGFRRAYIRWTGHPPRKERD